VRDDLCLLSAATLRDKIGRKEVSPVGQSDSVDDAAGRREQNVEPTRQILD